MRSILLSAAAATALALVAAPAFALQAPAAATNPCEVTDPVAHGAALAQAKADILASHPECAAEISGPVASSAPITPTYSSTYTESAPTVSATDTAATEPVAPPVATPSSYDTTPTFTNQLVTNGPVPDTPENRAKYGAPMSNAGKRTAPAGN